MCETIPCEMDPGQSRRPLENHMSSTYHVKRKHIKTFK